MRSRLGVVLAVALVSQAWANPASSSHVAPSAAASRQAANEKRANDRFPQPVRAGDLVGRRLLAPEERQPVLGRIGGVVRDSDGDASLVIDIGGWFGLFKRSVAVSTEAVALLGEYVVLMDIEPKELNALPTYAAGSEASVAPNETLHIGIVKPFH
jgi:hypothetical protein